MKKILAFISVAVLTLASVCAKESVVVLRAKSALYEAMDSQTVRFSEGIPAGTILEKQSNDVVNMDIFSQGKKGSGIDFYAVSYEGKDYFIPESDSVAIGSAKNVAILTKDSVLFTNPHPAFFKNSWLPTGTIVVILDTPNKTFTEVMFFNAKDDVRNSQYVQTSKLSKNTNDIKAIQLLEKARTTEDKEQQKILLDEASKAVSSGSGKLTGYVNSEVNIVLGVSSFSDDDIVQVDEFIARIYTADGAKVNLRSLPGTAGDKVAQVENGWECNVTLATESKETIEDIRASWYYVSNGDTEGWVFGGYLKRGENGPSELQQF